MPQPPAPKPTPRPKDEAPIPLVGETVAPRPTDTTTPKANVPTVDSDRKCLACGYALKGLPIGSPCPECGTPIRSLKFSKDDGLLGVSTETLKQTAAACGSLSIAGYTAVGSVFLASIFREDPFQGPGFFQRLVGWDSVYSIAIPCVALSTLAWAYWAMMVVPMTRFMVPLTAEPERVGHVLWMKRLRVFTILSQCLWPVAAAISTWVVVQEDGIVNGSGASTLFGYEFEAVGHAASFIRVFTLLGMGFLAWSLSRFAFQAKDTTLAWRFSAAAFAMAGAWPLIVICNVIVHLTENYFLVFVTVILWILFLVGLGLFAVAMAQMPKLALAAISSQQAALERDRRAMEKAAQERVAALQGKPSPFDQRRTITSPTPCLNCKRELQGLKYGQKCPECGHRIGDV
jgi:predicted RNA-binding Zn-ribbon protein involved in translation (DUF1610 family)